MTHTTQKEKEKAFLVAVDTETVNAWKAEESLDELERLAHTAGAEVVGRMAQKMPSPHQVTYLGKGKLEELVKKKEETGYTLVILDDELAPVQQKNLEKALGVKIIDRVALILDIFARHARTYEGKLQVEMAQHQYLLPRLAGQWSHLERLGGGIGTRGPGESQLETDRRIIRQKISKLSRQLEELREHRQLHRQNRRRSGIPVVALVGYTNAGKSSLLNALSQAGVLAEDKLFATLDPTTRRLSLPDRSAVLLTDTVGFIHKLPPAVIEAFKATLEELSDAAVLLHVVDLTSHNAADQCKVVEGILEQMGLADKPRLTLLNKVDLLLEVASCKEEAEALQQLAHLAGDAPNTLLISARKKWGLKNLLEALVEISGRAKPPDYASGNDAL